MIRRIVIAALAAIVLFYTVVFIQMGTVWFFELEAMKELLMFFVFLVFTFWTYEKVAYFFNSKKIELLPSQAKAFFEGITVIFISLVYSVLFTFIPQFLFIPTMEFTPPGSQA